jgi:thiamine-monophosphate kinase
VEVARRHALSGGEDYELLLAVPLRSAAAFERACKRRNVRVSQIGRCTSEGLRLASRNGESLSWPPGYDHFAARVSLPKH